ncbi:FAD-dependent oxidoreductase [Actinokineospora sp. HUAS TT18]|uniref:FAD-dependent oxidoreductase n=1 Tax=Actinokineospora sp. HUAS TT18 TaxID=3447451 RepID=UPI003F520FBA
MRIAIVGAGIGGLTLAAALHREGLSAAVYERDVVDTARRQGYSISLTEGEGLRVLRELGLYEEIRAKGHQTTDFTFRKSDGSRLMCLRAAPGSSRNTIGIPRDVLRAHLLNAVPADWIIWGARCTGVAQPKVGHQLQFADSSSVDADLIVFADGVRSRGRMALIGDSLHSLELLAVGGIVRADVDHPLLGGGAFMSLSCGASAFVHRYGENGETVWSISLRSKIDALDGRSGEELQEFALRATRGWHSPIAELITATNLEDIVSRPYFDRNPTPSCLFDNCVLIGDAAHPMSPFQGQGANMAMVDALNLSRTLKANLDGDPLALHRYDKEAAKRNRTAVMRSRSAAKMFHTQSRFGSATRNATLRLLDLAMTIASRGKH